MRKTAFLIPILVVAIALVFSSLFVVDEREKGLVLRFGRVVQVKETPGLYFKVPFIDEVVRYDDRILSRDLDPIEITPLDDRRLVVDAFARYRIADVERFRQATGAGGQQAAALRLDSILRAQVREVLGQVTSNDILSTDRAELMLRIRNGAIQEAQPLGIEVIDVRLKRTDLPQANLEATFQRMISEREREAADEIARGNEAAQRTRAAADRTVVELVSDSTRQSEIIRGEADARRNNIFAAAYGADPEFFEFYRSMTAYERALRGETTRMVLSPDSEFFTFLQGANPRAVDLEAAAEAAAEVIEALELPNTDDLEGVPSVDEMPNADTLREEIEESVPELAPDNDPEG
ncbi:protease modulator HflC [Histidinibacterium lentulum]|uniref:Protein HflC n=1 Tax=Histidinibacterium lentulum TaxID=2480588 RepID=A0A3N2QY58_9RHOB|nr:protease modulator HflC [Histidinibacterium lentulum]ROU00131.1 protease modulator HflC [Histidinibacterium lentulum]